MCVRKQPSYGNIPLKQPENKERAYCSVYSRERFSSTANIGGRRRHIEFYGKSAILDAESRGLLYSRAPPKAAYTGCIRIYARGVRRGQQAEKTRAK
jgi:hypothetical protein